MNKAKGVKVVEQMVKNFNDNVDISKKVNINGSEYLLTYEKSDSYGWKYCSITPISEFGKRAGNILALTLILCAAI